VTSVEVIAHTQFPARSNWTFHSSSFESAKTSWRHPGNPLAVSDLINFVKVSETPTTENEKRTVNYHNHMIATFVHNDPFSLRATVRRSQLNDLDDFYE
jgi:hypothetical protein